MRSISEEILKAERNGDYPTVEELFRVIKSDTETVIADPKLIERLEYGDKVTADEIQAGSVQIWSSRGRDWAVEEFSRIPGLKKWSLLYDSFLGYMAGVLPLVDAGETKCFFV